jgi:glycosyltransferase involved in cell wall biosynthesis
MKYNIPIVTIDILLSTYNGDPYLKELMDSVLNQTFKDWRLIVRDDGSSDGTYEILLNYCKQFPDKITLVNNKETHLGACQSFAQLLEYSTAKYIMFCDQDDVWLPTKIAVTLNRMCELESLHEGLPILIHTDLKVVDKDLTIISESFWKFQHINPDLKKINNLLIMNNVTGCTMMINRELKMLSRSIPEGSVMHDWWIALVASVFGLTAYINSATILYRQHGKNDTGAMRYCYSVRYLMSEIGRFDGAIAFTRKKIAQSKAFNIAFKGRFSQDQLEVIYNFSTLLEKGRMKRLYDMISYRYLSYGYLRNLGLLLLWFLIRNTKATIVQKRTT